MFSQKRAWVPVLVVCCVAAPAVCVADEWSDLQGDWDTAKAKWDNEMAKLGGKSAIMAIMMSGDSSTLPPSPSGKFRGRFRAYAEKRAGKPEAIPALVWLITNNSSPPGVTNKESSGAWALAALQREHATDPDIMDLVQGFQMIAVVSIGEEKVLSLLETIHEKNPDRDVRGRAGLAFARLLYDGSPFARMTGVGGPSAEEKNRAKALLVKLKEDYAGTETAERAAGLLFSIENVQVGMKAPEMIGKDVAGNEIRLSQFRGKVVAMVFWATWCAPCMEALSDERKLVDKLKDKPFVLLGINVDDDPDLLKKTIKAEKITWPTIHDGPPGDSEICMMWNVKSFPRVIVIDKKGVIRHLNLIPSQIKNAVESLIAESTSPKSD